MKSEILQFYQNIPFYKSVSLKTTFILNAFPISKNLIVNFLDKFAQAFFIVNLHIIGYKPEL